jgi:hypothetical protein
MRSCDDNQIVLYLEDWQKKMIKDYLGVDCESCSVPLDANAPTIFRYGVRSPEPGYKRMYLTEWQIKELRDVAGASCDFIELTAENKCVMYFGRTE